MVSYKYVTGAFTNNSCKKSKLEFNSWLKSLRHLQQFSCEGDEETLHTIGQYLMSMEWNNFTGEKASYTIEAWFE